MFGFKKKDKFETRCIVLNGREFVEVNQAAYDYIRDLEKKVSEKTPTILYVCDRRACEDGCNITECSMTRDINHAVNFRRVLGDLYEEIHNEG